MCRVADHSFLGSKTRLWLVGATLLQAILTMGAALVAHFSGEGSFAGERGEPPSWITWRGFVALAMVSASMGVQAGVGVRLGSAFATSVVLTTIWVQIVGDAKLFQLAHHVKSRDYRVFTVLAVLVGAIVGRALVNALGAPSTLAIGAAFRVIIAFGWALVPTKS